MGVQPPSTLATLAFAGEHNAAQRLGVGGGRLIRAFCRGLWSVPAAIDLLNLKRRALLRPVPAFE